MRKEYTTEKRSETRTYHEFSELNAKGEKIAFEFVKCENQGGKNSLPYLWKKNGYIDRILETYWSVSTYATDATGCWGIEPQVKPLFTLIFTGFSRFGYD